MLRVAEHFAKTDTGRERRANEDALFARPPLFVVADGMGGARAGEVASGLVVETFERGMDSDAMPERGLTQLIVEANSRIHELAKSDSSRAGMGTTITSAYVSDVEVAVAHVGDSRAYRWREGHLERLTEDHSLVAELVRRGKISEAEAEQHPQRSVITRALGPEADVDVDALTHPAKAGDVYLLCSDGLTSMVPEPRIAEVLAASETIEEQGRNLINEANERGGRDNITVILFRLEQVDGSDGFAEAETRIEPGAGHAVRDAVADAPTEVPTEPATPVATAAAAPERTTPRPARPARQAPPPKKKRRIPGLGPLVAVLVVAFIIGTSAWIASRAVYFVGTDDNGFVSVFRGLPYELPAGIKLYEDHYSSGVAAAELPEGRQDKLLDHKLRSKDDASDLVRQLERGELNE